jgi:hypothetical protein
VTLSTRDRRALSYLALSLLLMLMWRYWSNSRDTVTTASTEESVPLAERRLAILREKAATVPGRETLLRQVSGELLQRERGLISGDTAAQAQAQLVAVVQRVAKKQTPAIEIRQTSFAEPQPFGAAYGEVKLSLSFDCAMEQVVNFLAELTAQPETVSTSEISIAAADAKHKTVSVRMTISGLVPRRLVPVKKGLATF